ncbi:hypothetical protein EV702DRAFT_1040889 [Suillus placidus]|uniref:Uncharacterized protein n=1 Tax=Suillus placidus TaxID=48579 RepID=A0A9P7A623_9AGAM|nr:hypothetical protein EV702DRAFT_1040889 [Suillus placidus]
MKDTLAEKATHELAFEEFDAAITPKYRSVWLAEMEAWEENTNYVSIPNVLKAKSMAITQAGAQLTLAELESEELHVLIASGIDLEEEQRRLCNIAELMGLHATDTQKGSLMQMWNSLRRRIDMWQCAQVLYLPVIQGLINQTARKDHENAECIKLCDLCLQDNKWELCYAQTHDALEELRQCLHIHYSLLTFKREWMCGQGANTRAQNALTWFH